MVAERVQHVGVAVTQQVAILARRQAGRAAARKLNLVAQMIRGKKVEQALNILKFSPKGMSEDVYKVLASAVANAENNHNLDVDALVVAEASVGKSISMKRFATRAHRITTTGMKLGLVALATLPWLTASTSPVRSALS